MRVKQIVTGIYISTLLVLFLSSQMGFADNRRNGLIKDDPHSLQYAFPPANGWSFEKLSQALLFAEAAGSTAVIVLHNGHLVLEWGKTTLRTGSHSVRKSLLSALYGVAVNNRQIDLSATLADIGIDDRPPCLTPQEKQATIADLLKARSGVFHPAAAEAVAMKNKRPSRGAFAPGEHWYYNNWDFNALGTIFERKTNLPMGQAFKLWIADPIGMQDFRPEDVYYQWEPVSLHPAYPFWISARDLARFGQLYLQEGRWGKTQVLPPAWIKESTTAYSKTSDGGYGYMWWIHPSGAYYADGYMGQKVLIVPDHQLVIVNLVFTGFPSFKRLPSDIRKELDQLADPVNNIEFRKLVDLIMAAAPP